MDNKKEIALKIYNETLERVVRFEIDIDYLVSKSLILHGDEQKQLGDLNQEIHKLKTELTNLKSILRVCQNKVDEYSKEQ